MDIFYVLFTIAFFVFVCSGKNQDQVIYCLKDTECELHMHAEDFTYVAVHWVYKQNDNASDTKIGFWYDNNINLKNGYNETVRVEKAGKKDMHLEIMNATSKDTGIYNSNIVLINSTSINTRNKLYVINKAWNTCVEDKKQLYNTTIDLNSSTDLVKNLTESYKDKKIQKTPHACSADIEFQKDGCYVLGEFVNGEKQCLLVETGPCTCHAEHKNRTLKGTSSDTGKDARVGVIVGCVVGVAVPVVIIIFIIFIFIRKKHGAKDHP